MSIRIIPRLDIKGANLVKGVHFEGLRVMGKPEAFAQYYYENGADELVYMDAVASLYERNSLTEIIRRTASQIFIPLTVGGGLRSVEDIREVLRAGADKVSLNTAAIRNPSLIHEASQSFGASTILVSIEAIRRKDGGYECLTDFGREHSNVDAFEWALRAVELGAGELMVTSIDREGTGKGFDLDLVRQIAESVDVPVIAGGGAGDISHVREVVMEGKADAVALASVLHYGAIEHIQIDEDEFDVEGNVEFLQGRHNAGAFSRIQNIALPAIKEDLAAHQLDVRNERQVA
ncbi:MAG: imidazole glycerol phosphate synthase cyclase subunit [Phycisphaerae bacterium]|nr:imidazole glycerol phosphate synthase cyclase subunit [Phycisphaerae bacterium]